MGSVEDRLNALDARLRAVEVWQQKMIGIGVGIGILVTILGALEIERLAS